MLQPLVMMAIFTLLFSRIANVPTGGVPYPVFAFVGLVPWTLFANGDGQLGHQPGGQPEPRLEGLLPAAGDPAGAVLAWIPDFVISSVLLFVIMADLRVHAAG